jgi:hypothetical protein
MYGTQGMPVEAAEAWASAVTRGVSYRCALAAWRGSEAQVLERGGVFSSPQALAAARNEYVGALPPSATARADAIVYYEALQRGFTIPEMVTAGIYGSQVEAEVAAQAAEVVAGFDAARAVVAAPSRDADGDIVMRE